MDLKIGKIRKISAAGNLKAEASVIVENALSLNKIKVIEGSNGLFISMPSEKYTDSEGTDKYAPFFHPIDKESREALQKLVLDAYNEL